MGWLGRCGRWLMARLAAFAGACRKRLGRGPTAGDPPVTVTPYAWQDAQYPHSSTGLWIVHTDFSSTYQSATARDAQQAFFPSHVDALMSGGEPAGGYPAGLVHRPYILTAFVYSDATTASLSGVNADDYEAYCAAHALDPEDGYLHYAGGQTLHDWLDGIDASGVLTTTYDTQTRASVYAAGDTVTVAGAQVSGTSKTVTNIVTGTNATITTSAAHGRSVGDTVALHAPYRQELDGQYVVQSVPTTTTMTVDAALSTYTGPIGVTVGLASAYNGAYTIGAPSSSGNKTTIALGVSGTAAVKGSVYRAADSTKTHRNRYRFNITNFPPPRWCINPVSTVRRAYEIDRTARIYAGALGYAAEGIYVDELGKNNLDQVANDVTLEYNPSNATQMYTDMGACLAAIVASVSPAPSRWVYQIGSGAYTSATTVLLDDGAKSAQKEQMLDLTVGNAWPGDRSTYILARLAAGDAMELASPNTLNDTITWGGGVYASDPVPAAVRDASNIRMAASCFAMALLIVDPAAYPDQLSLNVGNGHYDVPSYDLGGLDKKWLDLWRVPLGKPTAAFSRIVTGVSDGVGQPVDVYTRPFQGGLVVYRRVSGFASPTRGDTAAYTVTLPASSGATGQWQRVKSDGTLDSPITAIALRPPEGAILLPA